MAKYDPKRPRPTLGDDGVAPIDALIEKDPIVVSPVEVDVPSEDVPVTAADTAAGRESTAGVQYPSESSDRISTPDAGPHVSDVPVIPPPDEGTANRAVLAAVASTVSLVLAVAAIWRWKRRKG